MRARTARHPQGEHHIDIQQGESTVAGASRDVQVVDDRVVAQVEISTAVAGLDGQIIRGSTRYGNDWRAVGGRDAQVAANARRTHADASGFARRDSLIAGHGRFHGDWPAIADLDLLTMRKVRCTHGPGVSDSGSGHW